MPAHKGHKKIGGRKKGSTNKTTRSAKEAFQFAFDELGGAEGLVRWASLDPENFKTFYTLYARLIPVDVQAKVEAEINFKWGG